jgi:hypothetical protein
MKPVVRLLKIPKGQKKDAEGFGIVDNWLLATLGCDDEEAEIYVTTNYIRASELHAYNLLEPNALGAFIVNQVNIYYTNLEQQSLF